MKPVSNETVIAQLKWRYAVKQFDPARKISAADWKTLEDSLVLTPSSFGLQPWKFIVITNQSLREKLLPVSWGQRQVVDASHLVVFTYKQVTEKEVPRLLDRTAEVRGTPREALEAYGKIMLSSFSKAGDHLHNWQSKQVYIALGQFMTTAAMLGIDTCPMEGLEPAKYDEILGLTGTGFTTLCICPAGYRAESDKYAKLAKVRYPHDEVIQRIE